VPGAPAAAASSSRRAAGAAAAALAAAALAGCAPSLSARGGPPAPTAAAAAPPAPARPLSAEPPLSVEDGPAVADPAALLAWLEANGPRRVQLPVVLVFAPGRLGFSAATVGATPGALALRPYDAALGVSLLDHARRLCPEAATCAVWLEGRWGARPPALGTPDPAAAPEPHGFDVLRVLGPADAGATHARGEKQ
jgi:hypothetical protein